MIFLKPEWYQTRGHAVFKLATPSRSPVHPAGQAHVHRPQKKNCAAPVTVSMGCGTSLTHVATSPAGDQATKGLELATRSVEDGAFSELGGLERSRGLRIVSHCALSSPPRGPTGASLVYSTRWTWVAAAAQLLTCLAGPPPHGLWIWAGRFERRGVRLAISAQCSECGDWELRASYLNTPASWYGSA
eukprot:SAG11_NODE_1775_length_4269_cov_3.089448_3_plen_188_part_00